MSSILKALQKLERDTADSQGPHDPHRSLRQLVPRKMAGRSRGLLIRKAAFTTFAAVFLGAVSWALWLHPLPASRSTVEQTSRKTQRSTEKPLPASPTADRDQAPATPPAESKTLKTVLSPSAGKDSESITAPARSAGMAPNTSAALPPLPQQAPAKPTVPAAKNRPLPHKAPAESRKAVAVLPSPAPAASGADAASVPVAKPLPPPEAPPAATAPAQTDVRKASRTMVDVGTDTRRKTGKPTPSAPSGGNHEDLPVKTPDEAGLAIQALVWSAAPEDRLVVVNGNILKEGGSIEGASVAFIGEDYIIVRKDGARWKLKFQLK